MKLSVGRQQVTHRYLRGALFIKGTRKNELSYYAQLEMHKVISNYASKLEIIYCRKAVYETL